ncbi:MAG TPA: NADH-ubiquinone oxidoreductase-F iron-sulfur binding region domain-containing protein [Longimicrobiales bacterium]|nr:NADH-ubiquinone oxidoreductase-F iron-sulfur binding region domain-containing protein [Longimicrobiales bacterium]
MPATTVSAADQALIDRWKQEPAPLLPLLHAFHDRDGHLSDDAIRAVSAGLGIPLADLYGTVTFYHHFAREPGGLAAPRVCDGPVCRMRGADAALAGIDGATAMPCSGRCDDPVPVLRGHETWVVDGAEHRHAPTSPLPPRVGDDVRAGAEECVFRHIRHPERATLAGYRATGGYEALERAVTGMTPEAILDLVDASGLAGRGGAGFPTGRKWRAVREAEGGPKTVVCNADEGEPGCFKDRALMDHDPHAVLEGMALACVATGAERAFLYLRYEYPETDGLLERAVAEAETAGVLGEGIFGTGTTVRIHIRRGAGAYICGEETSLLNSLEGHHPFPRNRPPFPVTHGYEGTPTAVNNVETLASVPPIVRKGAEWYQGLGLGDHAGTKVISLSGDVARPGNYEVPLGLPLHTLLHDWAGGGRDGRGIQAVTMAGLSGGFLAGDDLDVTLDEPSIRAKSSFLGAGGVMVFDETRDMIEVARQAMSFFAHESCGKCFPCRIGTKRLTERLAGSSGPGELEAWLDEVADLNETMMKTSACGLGQAAPLITRSLVKYFPGRVRAHVEG